jgi:hypothetical protein
MMQIKSQKLVLYLYVHYTVTEQYILFIYLFIYLLLSFVS